MVGDETRFRGNCLAGHPYCLALANIFGILRLTCQAGLRVYEHRPANDLQVQGIIARIFYIEGYLSI